MAEQIRVNYTSSIDEEIDRIAHRAATDNRPVVVQKPGVPGALGGLAGRANENFNRLLESLERRGVAVTTYTDPTALEPVFDADTVDDWGFFEYLTAAVSGLLFVVTWPLSALLGLTYRRTGNERYADYQQAIVRNSLVNRDLRRAYAAQKRRQRRRIRREIETVEEETGSDPLVVTNMDVRI